MNNIISITCVVENNIYFPVTEKTVLYLSIRPSLLIGLSEFPVFLLVSSIFFFCLFDLVPQDYITPGESFAQNSVLKLS